MSAESFHACSAPNCGTVPHPFRRGMEWNGMEWNGEKPSGYLCMHRHLGDSPARVDACEEIE